MQTVLHLPRRFCPDPLPPAALADLRADDAHQHIIDDRAEWLEAGHPVPPIERRSTPDRRGLPVYRIAGWRRPC